MAYGSGDVIREYAEDAEKLDAKVTEAKKLLVTCKQFLEVLESPTEATALQIARKLLYKQIDDYVSWMG
jgi:hypothetical protein